MQEALNQKIDAFVAANKEQILKDIATLVSINSVEGTPEEGAPYGAGPRAALDKTLELAAGMGLATRNCENHIGYAELAGADARSIWLPSAMWTWCRRATAGRKTPSRWRSATAG